MPAELPYAADAEVSLSFDELEVSPTSQNPTIVNAESDTS